MEKPTSKRDLSPPFDRIGDPNWDRKLRALLDRYGVPQPEPVPAAAVLACERRLGVELPAGHRRYLESIGPQDRGQAAQFVSVLHPGEIRYLHEWFGLPADESIQWREHVVVDDGWGDSDIYTLFIPDGSIHYMRHAPFSHARVLQSFDDLIRAAAIDIHIGYYGWPDEQIHQWAGELKLELFGAEF